MKRIISFKINGFKAENRIAEINFSKDNVTVIYGDNGCGKTTFLKTIFLFLSQYENSLNIKWQRELMSLLSKLLPDTQIIVASHSPALAKRNPQFLYELKVWIA